MSTSTVRATAASRRTWEVAGPAVVAIALGLMFVWQIADAVSVQSLPGRPQQDRFTVHVSAIADFAARIAGAVTLGALAGIAFFVRPKPGYELSERGLRLAKTAAHAGQLWGWAAVLQTFASPAFVNGVPLFYTLLPGAWWDFLTASPTGLAWATSAIVGFVAAGIGYRSRRVAPFALTLVAGALAQVFVTTTGNVSVGADHDWATDASVWVSLAMTALISSATAIVLIGGSNERVQRRLHRYDRLAPWCLVPAAAGLAVVGWQQLAGTAPGASMDGQVLIASAVVLALLAAATIVRRLRGAARSKRALAWLIGDVVLLVVWLALVVAADHLAPPRFVIPQTIQINYLGYEVNTPVSAARLFGLGRPNLLWVVLSLSAIGAYWAGVLRLRRRGGGWPVGRTIAWTAGWLLMLWLAVTGFWEYSTAVYSWHMFVHMTVNMLVPVLCVLGGPITLIQDASLDRSHDLLGPRELSFAITTYRPFTRLLSPPVLWVNYVGSLFLIYFTPLFPWLMRFHWAHQLMLLYFMVTGYLFFNMIVGVDKQVHELPHLVKLALVISVMPFHAIFAVGIMSSRTLIGADFYEAIAIPWVPDLLADQNVAGQITWILGEIPLFIVMIALAAQWFSHDRAENAVSDVAQDSGDDDSFDTYNDMLAALAQHDREADRKKLS